MAVSLKTLGIDRLSVEERLTLVEDIWDSIAADSAAVPLTPEQTQELERRLAEAATEGQRAPRLTGRSAASRQQGNTGIQRQYSGRETVSFPTS